jgi:hypothetical protein
MASSFPDTIESRAETLRVALVRAGMPQVSEARPTDGGMLVLVPAKNPVIEIRLMRQWVMPSYIACYWFGTGKHVYYNMQDHAGLILHINVNWPRGLRDQSLNNISQ